MNESISPMRPGVNLGVTVARGWSPPGWGWQVKINDERAVCRTRDRCLYNRHGVAFDRLKAAPFRPVLEELCVTYSAFPWLDLGLLGFRDKSTFGGARGAVVVFDLPNPRQGENLPYRIRREFVVHRLPVLDLLAGEAPRPGMAYCFEDYDHAGELFERTRGVPGLEGIVGRILTAPYCFGDSPAMAKARWLRA